MFEYDLDQFELSQWCDKVLTMQPSERIESELSEEGSKDLSKKIYVIFE